MTAPTGGHADPRPMIGVVDERTFLLAFTSQQHVTRFARTHGRSASEGGTPSMSITPAAPTALTTALIGQGVAGIVFNEGVHGFLAPATALDAMWDQFGRTASKR